MNKIFMMIACLGLTFSVKSQDENLAKMWKMYREATTDTAKVPILCFISNYYSVMDTDSSYILARQALQLAKKTGRKELETTALFAVSNAFVKMGAFQQGLETGLQGLKEAEILNKTDDLYRAYYSISFIYSAMEDLDKAIQYSYKLMDFPQFRNDMNSSVGILVNLGDFYLRKNQLDSARYYNNRAFEVAEKIGSPDLNSLLTNNFGNIFLQMKQPEMALLYYRQSLPYAIQTKFTDVVCESCLGIAKIFDQQKQNDSALYYARTGLEAAINADYPKYILQSSTLLGALYKKWGNSDSALKYVSMSMATRDSLFGREKMSRIKALELQETARQQDLADAEATARRERRENIQYAIILIGIVSLLVLVLLLSRSFIVHHNWVRFLGILSLLLIFEFINLYLHPFLNSLTNHSPIAMLLFMAGIASLLIPLHHRMEHWIIGKLVEKNKAIRLAMAKKIVATLEG